MKVKISAVAGVVLVAVSLPALAYDIKPQGTNAQGNLLSVYTSRLTLNGQGYGGTSEQAQSGQRSTLVVPLAQTNAPGTSGPTTVTTTQPTSQVSPAANGATTSIGTASQ